MIQMKSSAVQSVIDYIAARLRLGFGLVWSGNLEMSDYHLSYYCC